MNRGTIGKTGKEGESVDEKNFHAKRLKGTNSNNKVLDISSKPSDLARPKAVAVVKKSGIAGPIFAKNKSKLLSPKKLKPLSINFQPRVIPQLSQKSEKRQQDFQKSKLAMKVQQESGETIHQSKKKEMKSKSNKNDDNLQEVIEIPLAAITDANGRELDDEKNNDVETKNNEKKIESKEIIVSEIESINNEAPIIVDISDDFEQLNSQGKSEEKPDEKVTHKTREENDELNDENPAHVLVESTTSESPPSVDVQLSQNDNPSQNDGEHGKTDEDPSFISYDSSIMLKDVKIKLNDCLRDNSKLVDVTDPNANISGAFQDLSFGRTLRSISGRNSIGRLRHVTIRDRQLTPNDSLFVNTSSTSFSQDNAVGGYTSQLLDSSCRNGTPSKRKLNNEINASTKKIKREDNSILNSSWEYLRNLRRPIQVSTPNPKGGYKFDIGEKQVEGNNEEIESEIEQTVEPKKWCVVM